MPEQHSQHAVVICTRNRPDDLHRTLDSIVSIADEIAPTLIIIDGSDAGLSAVTEKLTRTISQHYKGRLIFHQFAGKPSAARQRNKGLELLPSDTGIVHFMDDDVSLHPGYFTAMEATFRKRPDVGGVGALIEDKAISTTARGFWHRLFLLDSTQPGRVLPSGHVSFGQTLPDLPENAPPFRVEWLTTCGCAFRRAILAEYQFDDELDRQTTEDRDLSFRISREWQLLVQPQARMTHHASAVNRADTEQATYERFVNRLRFIKRTKNHPVNYLAFWWSELGQLLALLLSDKPESREALRGKLRAIKDVLPVRSTDRQKTRVPSQ